MSAHRLFSSKSRPIHQGNYPLHRLHRTDCAPDLTGLSAPALSFRRADDPESIVNAMAEHQAMLDTICDGLVNGVVSEIPDDPVERSNHLKSFGYFSDASMVGVGPMADGMWLEAPRRNPQNDALAEMIRTRQTKTLAAGIDQIMADLKDSVSAAPREIGHHRSVIVFLYEYRRDPRPDEPGAAWIQNAQAHRGCLLSSEAAIVIANYMRLLGFDAKAHTLTSSDICLTSATIAAGLAWNEKGRAVVPFLGERYGVAAIT
ncbi:MAG: NAD-binding oxidoreductase, partial [Pseudomonadota bacterium]|nr:NAD-binding oxidoreductase [Pseudomonadota bacterium]